MQSVIDARKQASHDSNEKNKNCKSAITQQAGRNSQSTNMPLHNRTSIANRRMRSTTTIDPGRTPKGKSHRNPRRNGHWESVLTGATTKSLCTARAAAIILVTILVGVMMRILLFSEYAWVYQRCLVAALVRRTTAKHVQCQEAWSHMVAETDPTLWTKSSSSSSSSVTILWKQTLPVTNVHFTLTAPFSDSSTRSLARCSVEAMARFCNAAACRINLWVVDKAAQSMLHDDRNNDHAHAQNDAAATIRLYLKELVDMIGTTTKFCVRIISDPISYIDTYNTTTSSSSSSSIPMGHCPSPTPRSLHAARRLRTWLSSQPNQPSEHTSDAWRLVALLEWGGMYLDLDVVPLSPWLLRLPRQSIPVQHKVGAYRVNGAVLRLGDDKSDNDTNDEERTASVRHGRRGRQPSFLRALEQDHMYWAPGLARLPQAEQTYGFLGPAALTRVYSRHEFRDDVTVLGEEVIESSLDESLCTRVADHVSLAAHFGGKDRKLHWRRIMMSEKCLETILHDVCPRTAMSMD
jgi:Glycosyltransferase sugar-binding region containing DXD motif